MTGAQIFPRTLCTKRKTSPSSKITEQQLGLCLSLCVCTRVCRTLCDVGVTVCTRRHASAGGSAEVPRRRNIWLTEKDIKNHYLLLEARFKCTILKKYRIINPKPYTIIYIELMFPSLDSNLFITGLQSQEKQCNLDECYNALTVSIVR